MWPVALGAAALAAAAGVATVELATWRMSRRRPALRRSGRCAVIVLGYPSARNGALHPMQKWRTRIAVRTLDQVDDGWLVFSGGATRGATRSEAAVMARYAVTALGVPTELVTLEERARSTWENVLYSLPLVDARGADQIAIASDPFHAEKACRYLVTLRPELASRVGRAADYRVLERWWLKAPSALYYLWLRARGTFGKPPPGFECERPW